VSQGTFSIETAEDFLPYYDEIFTDSLMEQIYLNQYTEDRADLMEKDGMIGGANGAIWFAETGDGFTVETVQNLGGWSLRYDGTGGVTAG
jgi:hypothetical protein